MPLRLIILSDDESPHCIKGNDYHPVLLIEALHGEADAMEVVVLEIMGDAFGSTAAAVLIDIG